MPIPEPPLSVEDLAEIVEAFAVAHEETFGYRSDGEGLQFVSLKVVGQGISSSPRLPDQIVLGPANRPSDSARRAYYGGTLQTGAFRPANVAASADTMEALLLLIRTGEFIAHLPCGWAKTWVGRGEIRPLLPEQFSYYTQFEVVIRTGTQLINQINTFLTDLYAVYREAGHRSDESARL